MEPAPLLAEMPIPHWTVQTVPVTKQPTAKDPAPKPKQTYYWNLQNPGSFRIPRYYPANFGEAGKPNWYFLPEKYWANRNNKNFNPFSHGFEIHDARQTSKTGLASVTATTMLDVRQRLEDGQETYLQQGRRLSMAVNPPVSGPEHLDKTHGRYLTFDKPTPVYHDTLYVRLRDKDVRLMVTGGGRDQPEEIYMTKALIDNLAAGIYDLSKTRFEIRTGDGCGRFFEMDDKVATTKDAWNARLARAVNGLDMNGGWNRMINPKLKLYLVSVSPDWEKDFVDIMRKVDKEEQGMTLKSQQDYELLSREQMAIHSEGPFTLIATSPFNQYETWITTNAYNGFQTARGDRAMPETPEALLEIGDIVDKKPEHKSAQSQRQVVQTAFDDQDWDRIATAVSAEKIGAARGTREQALDQKEVMGGVSATVIAAKLGWPNPSDRVPWSGTWPATGLYPAEWLHRCAYSWGGLGDAGNIHSSQIRQNLVFGTSECNSVMTRYEKSWQRLVILERELRGVKFEWVLRSRTHRCNPTATATETVRWMCDEIEYSMDVVDSRVLHCTGPLTTRFYPFKRGFFTLIEQRIDAMILTTLYELHAGETPLPAIHPDDEITFEDIKEEEVVPTDPPGYDEKVKPPGYDEKVKPPGIGMLIENEKNSNSSNYGDAGLWGKKTVNKEEKDPSPMNSNIPMNQDRNPGKYLPVWNAPQDDPKGSKRYSGSGDKMLIEQGKNANTVKPSTLDKQQGSKGPAGNTDPSNYYLNPATQPNPYQNQTGLGNVDWGSPKEDRQKEKALMAKPSDQDNQHENAGYQMHEGGLLRNNSGDPSAQYFNPSASEKKSQGASGQIDWGNTKKEKNSTTKSSTQENQHGNPGGKTSVTYSKQLPNPASKLLDSQNLFLVHENSAGDLGKEQSPQSGSLNSPSFLGGGNSLSFLGGSGIQSSNPVPPTTSASNGSKRKVVNKATDNSQSTDAETQSHLLNSMFFGFGPQAGQQAAPAPPVEHVAKAPFALFGLIPAELQMLQSPSTTAGIHQRVTLPGPLSLGTLLPPLAGSPLDAITLLDTTLTYRSQRTPTVPAGLTLATTMHLSGVLAPVSTVLRDVFHQEKPRINVSGLISTQPNSLKAVPAPAGFTLRGELPDVDVNLFGVLDVTKLGVGVMARRKGSAGGYDYSYGFDGRGRIADVELEFSMIKDRDYYHIFLAMTGEIWNNVGGVVGINLENVQFEASWTGTKLTTVELQLQATFKLRTASMLLRGLYSKTNYELAGTLHNADLTTLQHLYEDIFHTALTRTTSHTLVFSTLSFLVSKHSGITLSGAVTIDGHTAANATIALSTAGIHITGAVAAVVIPGAHVTVESASLDLTISREEMVVKLAGRVSVDEMDFEVSVYLSKSRGGELEYTLYGKYNGDLRLRHIVKAFEGTFMDVSLQKVALIASNMETPAVEMTENVFAYPVTKGLQIFAEAARISPVSQLLRLAEKPLQLCAFYTPDSGSFGVGLTLPTTDLIAFDCMRSGPLALKLYVADNAPHLAIIADVYIAVAQRKDPLTLQLSLDVNATGAEGSAKMIGMWENPFDLSPELAIGDIEVGLGIEYATFFTTGTPSSLTFGGRFILHPPPSKGAVAPAAAPTTGKVLLHLSTNPTQQLLTIDFANLSTTKLSHLLSHLGSISIDTTHSADTLFFDTLTVYLSTGVVHNGTSHPPGIRLTAAMRVFGKPAHIAAELSRAKAVLTGHVAGFTLGDVTVSGVSTPDASMEIELSAGTQKVHIDGMVLLGANKVLVDIHVEYAPLRTCHFYVYVEFVGARRLEVKATLEGELTPLLDGREFVLFARMQRELVDYVAQLANAHIALERQEGRADALRRAAEDASAELEMVDAAYAARKAQCEDAVEKVVGELELARLAMREKVDGAQGRLHAVRGAAEAEQREMAARIGREREERRVAEQAKTVALTAAVQVLEVAERDLERAAMAAAEQQRAVQAAAEAKRVATDAFEQFEAECAADLAKEPATSDPAHTVWEWARRELMRQLEQKRAALQTATVNHAVAHAGFDPSHALQIAENQLQTKAQLANTTADLHTHQSTADARAASFEQAGDDALARLQSTSNTALSALTASLAAAQAEQTAFESTLPGLLAAARAAHNVAETPEHTALLASRKRAAEATLASRSFATLQQTARTWGPHQTAPLQYALHLAAGHLLAIKAVTVAGRWRDDGKMTAMVDALVGFVEVRLFVQFCVDDAIAFFTALWGEIGRVINEVAGTMRCVLDEGGRVLERLLEDAADGVGVVIQEGRRFVVLVDEAMDEVAETMERGGKEAVEALGESIDDAKKVGKALGYPVEEVLDAVEGVGKDVVDTVEDGVQRLGETVEQFDQDLDTAGSHFERNIERTAEDAIGNLGNVERKLGESLVQVDMAKRELDHTVQGEVDKWDHFGQEAAWRLEHMSEDDREQELMRVVMESQTKALEALERIGHATEDYEREVDRALDTVGSEVKEAANGVVDAVEEVWDDVGNAISRWWS